MGKHFTRGFTIIETMLVLAITGAMIAGLLVGVGSSISAQRYKDSVASFRALLQDQYSEVMNVSNDRDTNLTCDAAANISESNGGPAPGQSDCVLLGKYISIVGEDITTAVVVGYIPPNTSPTGASDVSAIKDSYILGISTGSIVKTSLEWGAQIAWPQGESGATPRRLGVLIVRSPNSGTNYTFTTDSVNDIDSVSSATLKSMLVENTSAVPGQAARTVCIDPNGASVPERLAVYIGEAANGPSSIESRSNITVAGSPQC